MTELGLKLSSLLDLYNNKGAKISSAEPVFDLVTNEIPRIIKNFCVGSCNSTFWEFEGSVGKGSWSRTPWIAMYDRRVTDRASDGFYVAFIVQENMEKVFLLLMNSSTAHINYTPFHLKVSDVEGLPSFQKGVIPSGLLAVSGRGNAPLFEKAALLWKSFSKEDLLGNVLEQDLVAILEQYQNLAKKYISSYPKDKPFKSNPFLSK
ncbi:MrcB family domain-containing protein [Bdellovibrio sp. HCB274]|uniref:MrcB family domain-containing protein n=1 Tax=Bdellovibrio sp. HCB274 TaxID=3394361 RepID=UPI0039B41B04